ncbi:Chitinase-3-Like Protein 2 [Manis pentadactyla]|nr:Chitinase-3-Like Protein 2 [Manis pentadactyla]
MMIYSKALAANNKIIRHRNSKFILISEPDAESPQLHMLLNGGKKKKTLLFEELTCLKNSSASKKESSPEHKCNK